MTYISMVPKDAVCVTVGKEAANFEWELSLQCSPVYIRMRGTAN